MFHRSHRSTAWLALMLTVGGCAAVVCPLANRLDAERGLALALLACAVCLTTCLITVELFFRFQSPDTAYVLALLGQLIRMAIPLALCAATWLTEGLEPARILAICFVIVYPAVLAVETWLFVKELQRHCS
jgi:drug/metabolite transporter (DMT)-like permease